MGWALPAAALGNLGLGAWQAFNQPSVSAPTPQNYYGPEGANIYDPAIGGTRYIEAADPNAIQADWMRRLYQHKLYGTGYDTWAENRKNEIARLQGLLGGPAEADISQEAWRSPGSGALPNETYADWARRVSSEGTPSAVSDYEREQWQAELDALMGLGDEDISWGMGTLGEGGEFGIEGAPQEEQLKGTVGAFREEGSEAIQDYYQQYMENLARRGVLGGTPEFEMAERQAESITDLENQAQMMADSIRRMNQRDRLQLLTAIEAGISGEQAMAMAGQQMGQQSAYQTNILEQQRQAYLAQQMAMQQQAMQQAQMLAGQGVGYLNQMYGPDAQMQRDLMELQRQTATTQNEYLRWLMGGGGPMP